MDKALILNAFPVDSFFLVDTVFVLRPEVGENGLDKLVLLRRVDIRQQQHD